MPRGRPRRQPPPPPPPSPPHAPDPPPQPQQQPAEPGLVGLLQTVNLLVTEVAQLRQEVRANQEAPQGVVPPPPPPPPQPAPPMVQMLERGCEVLQRRQEMATQKRGANQFQQQNQFGGDKRQRVQGESSQGQRQQPQQQRAAPQDRAPQQPNRPQGNQGQQQPRPQQQQPRDDGRVQCWDCGERGHVKRNCPRGNRQQTGGVTQGRMFAISQDNARVSDDVIEGW
ncbi:zinc finger protein [Macleaya cordata]|uniref:Zinc finger protein n=1 Tax=Macleaya cordata TaxID=56857 RepID=A0A200Q2Y9_MACCD|nr:zinc finger protein [Macleaya cordata]